MTTRSANERRRSPSSSSACSDSPSRWAKPSSCRSTRTRQSSFMVVEGKAPAAPGPRWAAARRRGPGGRRHGAGGRGGRPRRSAAGAEKGMPAGCAIIRVMSSGGMHGGMSAAAGTPGTGAGRSMRGGGRKPPPLMDPTRERDTHRIIGLFTPYRVRLTIVLVMIMASAGASMVNPFLLRTALDQGLLAHDGTTLSLAVGGMIAIALFSNATSVWQTYLSNVVGQRVMHDLRAAVYRRLQQMSLAFFTRTRTGEVQSRIANDIGGLDAVVTTTATTIAANATTVIAALVAMCLLDVRLALFSLVFVPPSVWATRR